MIDEAVLEELLAEVGAEIPVPAAGPENVLAELAVVAGPNRRSRPRLTKPLIAAAAVLVVALGGRTDVARFVELEDSGRIRADGVSEGAIRHQRIWGTQGRRARRHRSSGDCSE